MVTKVNELGLFSRELDHPEPLASLSVAGFPGVETERLLPGCWRGVPVVNATAGASFDLTEKRDQGEASNPQVLSTCREHGVAFELPVCVRVCAEGWFGLASARSRRERFTIIACSTRTPSRYSSPLYKPLSSSVEAPRLVRRLRANPVNFFCMLAYCMVHELQPENSLQ